MSSSSSSFECRAELLLQNENRDMQELTNPEFRQDIIHHLEIELPHREMMNYITLDMFNLNLNN